MPKYSTSNIPGGVSDLFNTDGAIGVSFEATSNYSPFEGNTNDGNEGRWIGYKHSQNYAEVLLLTRPTPILAIRSGSIVWNMYRLIP